MNRSLPMRRCLKAIPLLGVLLAACSSPPSQVDEIISSHLAARGGKARLQALSSLRQSGLATASGGRIARVVREIKRPGFFRLEFTSQGTKSVFASDGETAWQVAPQQGILEPQETSSETNLVAGIGQRDIEGPLLDWREKGHLVELVGREELAGGEAFKLKLTLSDGAIRHDYVDVATHLIVRSEFARTLHGRSVLLVNTLSDFREVDGIVFPHHVETEIENRPEVIRIDVEKIELDPDLDDERFRFPG